MGDSKSDPWATYTENIQAMKRDITEKTKQYQRAIKASVRPDLKQPAFKDPTPVDPMLQRFACIEV